MKFYRNDNWYWARIRDVEDFCIGLLLKTHKLYKTEYVFTRFEYIGTSREITYRELPDRIIKQFQEYMSDPLFEIEFERWAKKNGY